MFIKEYKKNIVILKGIASDYIDEALIILKGDPQKDMTGKDIVKEANRIITEYRTGKKRKRLPFSLPSFFLGIFTASVLAGILFLIFSVVF